MADKTPVRVVYDGSGVATGLAEYQTGETVSYAFGGTGLSALGSAGSVLRVNGAGNALEWGGEDIADILSVGSTLTAPSNADFTITTAGTGNIVLNDLTVHDSTIQATRSNDNLILKGSGSGKVSINDVYTFPSADGSTGHFLKTDGSGTLSFAALSLGDLTITGSTISGPSNSDVTLSPGGTGNLVLDDITISDNTISTNSSNANLEINANGSGTIILENLKLATGATVTGILDEDAMGTNSATQLATQQSIKAYVDGKNHTALTGTTNNTVTTVTGANAIQGEGNLQFDGTTLAVSGSATISGNLTVSGEYFTTTTTNTSIEDNLLELNTGISQSLNDSGIIIERGSTGDNAGIIWDESADKFVLGTTTATAGDKSGGITIAPGTLEVASLTADSITITDNIISTNASNTNLELSANSSGIVHVTDSFKVGTGATVTTILDEDAMGTNSATALSTQQSIKAYVDAKVTAEDLDVASDSGSIDIDLDSEALTIAGGTGLASSASSTTVTLAIDSTVTTLTGTQTLTNKTLTAPTITATSTTVGGKIKFLEGTDNGTNAVTLVGAASTADVDLILPAAADTLVGKATTDTLTNKTFDLGGTGNSLTGSLAEFNSALQSESFASLTGSETLTNKTLTSPVINGPTGDWIKIAGTNFTGSLLVGHATTGTLDAASQNTGVGGAALDALTSADNCTAVGYNALTAVTSGTHNTGVGRYALSTITTTGNNTAVGTNAQKSATGGAKNTSIGEDSLDQVTGDGNIALGYQSGDNITSGSGNVVIGKADVSSATGDDQLSISDGEDGSVVWIKGTSAGAITFNSAYTFPTADGSDGQALVTDGSGALTFGSVSSNASDDSLATARNDKSLVASIRTIDSFNITYADSVFYFGVMNDIVNEVVSGQIFTIATNDSAAFLGANRGISTTGTNFPTLTVDVSNTMVRLRAVGSSAECKMSFYRIPLSTAGTADATSGNTVVTSNTDVDSASESIDSWAHATYRAAKYFISVDNDSKTEVMAIEALVIHDGSDADITYSSVNTGSNDLLTLTATISGSNVVVSAAGLGTNLNLTIHKILLKDSMTAAENGNQKSIGAVTVSSTATAIDTMDLDTANGAVYYVVGKNATEAHYSINEVFVVATPGLAVITNGPSLSTKGTAQLEFTAAFDTSSENAYELFASSTSGSSTVVNAYRINCLAG